MELILSNITKMSLIDDGEIIFCFSLLVEQLNFRSFLEMAETFQAEKKEKTTISREVSKFVTFL